MIIHKDLKHEIYCINITTTFNRLYNMTSWGNEKNNEHLDMFDDMVASIDFEKVYDFMISEKAKQDEFYFDALDAINNVYWYWKSIYGTNKHHTYWWKSLQQSAISIFNCNCIPCEFNIVNDTSTIGRALHKRPKDKKRHV